MSPLQSFTLGGVLLFSVLAVIVSRLINNNGGKR